MPLLRHGSALVAALLAFLLMDQVAGRLALRHYRRAGSSTHFYGYKDSPEAIFDLTLALKAKFPVVIFGSCELTHEHVVPELAHRYLPEKLGVPVFAVGHGGMRSLFVAAHLSAFAQDLRNVPLVIILSPEIFSVAEERKTLFRFLEYLPTPLLALFHWSGVATPDLRNAIDSFISVRQDQITYPSAILRSIQGAGSRLTAYFKNYLPVRLAQRKHLYETALKSLPDQVQVPVGDLPAWDIWLAKASGQAKKQFASHPLGFSGEHRGPYPRQFSPPSLEGEEMQDFKILLELLKAMHARPLFILQSFHPEAYLGREQYKALSTELSALLKEAEFSFFDLNGEPNQPGLFVGPQYMGSYGWMLMNRAIYNHYQAVSRNR